MNIKKKNNSILTKLLGPLILFFILVLLLVWISEVLLFRKAYEAYQVRVISNSVKKILNSKDLDSTLETLAYENGFCIVKTDEYEIQNEYNTKLPSCAIKKSNLYVLNIMNNFISSKESSKAYYFKSADNNIMGYLYGLSINNKYVFIYSSLEDTTSITSILKNQMIYITFIAIIIAVIISYFLSKKITKPITEITEKAKYLGTGKNINFTKNNIKEIDELADALNFAQGEIGKTTELQRDLMANVSHDLKTPLTMIKAYAEMIKDISYKDKDKMDEHLNIIVDETDRLTLLVNDILDLSKLESDSDKLNIEKYDIVREVKNIIKRYEIIKETENYNFVVEMPEKLIVKADRNKINQVIYNLINNAINYTGDDKIVKINISKDKLIEIIDTGKGIKKEEIDSIWNRYYKTNKKHQRNVVSTGLGLAIVKEILLKHKFKYGVTSNDKGTRFFFKMK